MILNLANCGALRCVDHSAGAMRTFGWSGYQTQSTVVDGYRCSVSLEPKSSAYRMLVPFESDPSRLCLNVDGRIYIDGVHVLQLFSRSYATVVGGYLGTATHFFQFSGPSGIDTITLDTLGIIPASYSGGLRISGLTDPGATLVAYPTSTFDPPYPRLNYATVVDSDGTTADVYNWSALGSQISSTPIKLDAWVCGALGYDFYVSATRL